jgi:FMN phosphatase YigB (HAD superfamily)
MIQSVVVFDLGGVVFHWEPLTLLKQVMPHRAQDEASAKHLNDQIFQTMNVHGDWAQFDLGLVEPHELAERIERRTGLSSQDILALVDALPPHMTVKKDTVELMSDLREAGHKLVYLSNMPLGLAQWIEQDHAFFQWFENGIFSARVQQVKPDPVIFKTAIEHLGLQETKPVFLDDMQRNIDVAVQHGWQGVRFVSASQARQELVGLGLLAS